MVDDGRAENAVRKGGDPQRSPGDAPPRCAEGVGGREGRGMGGEGFRPPRIPPDEAQARDGASTAPPHDPAGGLFDFGDVGFLDH